MEKRKTRVDDDADEDDDDVGRTRAKGDTSDPRVCFLERRGRETGVWVSEEW